MGEPARGRSPATRSRRSGRRRRLPARRARPRDCVDGDGRTGRGRAAGQGERRPERDGRALARRARRRDRRREHRAVRRAASTTGAPSPSSARSPATRRCPRSSPRCCARRKVNLYEDSVLVKEPGARERTVWHQDLVVLPRRRRAALHDVVPARPGRRDDRRGAVRAGLAPLRTRCTGPNLFVSSMPIPGTEGELVPDVDALARRRRRGRHVRRLEPGRRRRAPRPHAARGRRRTARPRPGGGRSRCGTAATTPGCWCGPARR